MLGVEFGTRSISHSKASVTAHVVLQIIDGPSKVLMHKFSSSSPLQHESTATCHFRSPLRSAKDRILIEYFRQLPNIS